MFFIVAIYDLFHNAVFRLFIINIFKSGPYQPKAMSFSFGITPTTVFFNHTLLVSDHFPVNFSYKQKKWSCFQSTKHNLSYGSNFILKFRFLADFLTRSIIEVKKKKVSLYFILYASLCIVMKKINLKVYLCRVEF